MVRKYNIIGLPYDYVAVNMRSQRPRVLLFDIGGVCVVSPFQAILDYEKKENIPVGYINFGIRELTPHGSWHKLERGEIKNDEHFMKAWKEDLERRDVWEKFHKEKLNTSAPAQVPNIDTNTLYWTMMSTARKNDPYMYPALLKLKESGRFHMAAMSNTTVFPEGHEFNNRTGEDDVREVFDIFVSSAHVGMRKPNRDIYDYTLAQIREKWGDDIRPEDIVFVDDIGENLKTGKKVGFGTIRVFLGKTKDAVKQLEEKTGMKLLDASSRARL